MPALLRPDFQFTDISNQIIWFAVFVILCSQQSRSELQAYFEDIGCLGWNCAHRDKEQSRSMPTERPETSSITEKLDFWKSERRCQQHDHQRAMWKANHLPTPVLSFWQWGFTALTQAVSYARKGEHEGRDIPEENSSSNLPECSWLNLLLPVLIQKAFRV